MISLGRLINEQHFHVQWFPNEDPIVLDSSGKRCPCTVASNCPIVAAPGQAEEVEEPPEPEPAPVVPLPAPPAPPPRLARDGDEALAEKTEDPKENPQG